MNWRGKPLVSLETIINLIGATRTTSGLEVYARLDEGTYPAKIKVTDAELDVVNIHSEDFHPEWNYMIAPQG
jgi:Rhodopirellula transposase DDE domain